MKFVGSIEIEIWIIVWRKLRWRHNDVIAHLIFFFIIFKCKSTKGLSQQHTKFHLIEHKRAEIYNGEVNRQLWRKNGYCVTNFNRVWASVVNNHLCENCIQIGASVRLEICLLRHTDSQTHTHTHTHTHKPTHTPTHTHIHTHRQTHRQTAVKI